MSSIENIRWSFHILARTGGSGKPISHDHNERSTEVDRYGNKDEKKEKKRIVRIKIESPRLKRLSKAARTNDDVARDLDKLIKKLEAGHENPGIGSKSVTRTVREHRTTKGARLYVRKKRPELKGTTLVEYIDIVGESAKDDTQQDVIDTLIEMGY